MRVQSVAAPPVARIVRTGSHAHFGAHSQDTKISRRDKAMLARIALLSEAPPITAVR